jgi:hypothetical protein
MSNTPKYLSVAEVGRLLSVGDKPTGRHSVYRWVRQGVKVGEGIVRLQATKLPRGIGFTAEAVAVFLEQLQGALAEPVVQAAAGRPSSAERALRLSPQLSGGLRRCAPDEVGTYPMVSGGAGQLTRPAAVGHA